MLGEIMFHDVTEKPEDRTKRDTLRLGLQVRSDTVVVNMYRRQQGATENPLTVTTTTLEDAPDVEQVNDKKALPLLASIILDLGDLSDAIGLAGASSVRYKARTEVSVKSEEQRERDARFEQQRQTAEAAVAKFDKLYSEHEEATAKLVEAEAALRDARKVIEKAKEQGLELPEPTEPENEPEEVAVGAPGDAEDITT